MTLERETAVQGKVHVNAKRAKEVKFFGSFKVQQFLPDVRRVKIVYSDHKSKFIASEREASEKREHVALEDLDTILNPPKQHFFESDLEKNLEKDVYYAITTSQNPQFFLESMARQYKVSIEAIEGYVDKALQKYHKCTLEDVRFRKILERIKEIKSLEDPGRQIWELQALAKKYKRTVQQLMSAHDAALINQPKFELLDGLEVLKTSPNKFDWLVAGLLPMATTALLYAEGGTGKTLLANSIIKSVACGLSWNGFPTKHGKVLLMQTDEPAIVTAQNLKIAQFQEALAPGHLLISYSWQFAQMQQLRDAIAEYKPVFVVIDSLTSGNRTASSEEKDVEYGRCLYDLRDIAMEFGCAILVLHHENKAGGVRGSTAIPANVSEVWHLKRDSRLSPTHRILDIEKSRSGCSSLLQLQLDVDNYSWQHQGEFDPTQVGTTGDRPPNSLPLKAKLIQWFESFPGISFAIEDLTHEFGGKADTIYRCCDKLWRSGIIQFKYQEKNAGKGKTKYKVYWFPENPSATEPSSVGSLGTRIPQKEALGSDEDPRVELEEIRVPKLSSCNDSVALGSPAPGIGTTVVIRK